LGRRWALPLKPSVFTPEPIAQQWRNMKNALAFGRHRRSLPISGGKDNFSFPAMSLKGNSYHLKGKEP
jgi:hypothetical protein